MASEQERKEIFKHLVTATQCNWFLDGDIPNVLYLHFTDWANNFDLPLLESEGLLEYDPSWEYQPDGTWKDKFPPSKYIVTLKAYAILRKPGRWIFANELDLDRAEKDRTQEWIRSKDSPAPSPD